MTKRESGGANFLTGGIGSVTPFGVPSDGPPGARAEIPGVPPVAPGVAAAVDRA